MPVTSTETASKVPYPFCHLDSTCRLDFIVGAPYDGEDGRGAVYVYHGSKEGVRTEHTQRIAARDVQPDLRTFGWSLSAGRDIDKNDYPGNL